MALFSICRSRPPSPQLQPLSAEIEEESNEVLSLDLLIERVITIIGKVGFNQSVRIRCTSETNPDISIDVDLTYGFIGSLKEIQPLADRNYVLKQDVGSEKMFSATNMIGNVTTYIVKKKMLKQKMFHVHRANCIVRLPRSCSPLSISRKLTSILEKRLLELESEHSAYRK